MYVRKYVYIFIKCILKLSKFIYSHNFGLFENISRNTSKCQRLRTINASTGLNANRLWQLLFTF